MGQLAKNLFVFLVAEQGHPSLLVAPNTVHDGERHQHSGSYHWIDLTELASLDTSPNDSTEQLESARDDFVGVEPGEIGELMQLAEDESINGTEDRRADEFPIAAHHGTELLGWSSLSDRFFARLDGSDGGLPDHLAEEIFLVGEVEVNGPLGDSGPFGDILEAGLGEAAFAEHFEGGLDDLLGPVLRASSPFWLS